ncbi:MAG: hypothetical protein SGCHY_004432 [Lobulomycetales sp.]
MPEAQLLIPPLNFAMVCPGVYRSGFFNDRSHEFIRSLELRTIVTVSDVSHSETNLGFINSSGIKLLHIKMKQSSPERYLDEAAIRESLEILSDKTNHPVLIHCNKGKYRVGCIVACLRRMQGWAFSSALAEYTQFTDGKTKFMDTEIVEVFEYEANAARRGDVCLEGQHFPDLSCT